MVGARGRGLLCGVRSLRDVWNRPEPPTADRACM
jgi:hypothetical protein